MKLIVAFLQLQKRFARHEQGSVLIMFGLFLFVLVALGGAGIDLGRQQLMTLKLQQAADASAISTGTMTNNGKTLTQDQQQAVAQRYFKLNYTKPDDGTRPAATVDTSDGIKVTAGNTAETKTKVQFVNNVGVGDLQSQGLSKVSTSASGGVSQYDVILTMDNSDSMLFNIDQTVADLQSGAITPATLFAPPTRLDKLKEVATDFTTQILADSKTTNRIAANNWSTNLIGQVAFTKDSTSIKNFINAMTTPNNSVTGQTNSTAGLQDALDKAKDFTPGSSHVVIFLTDGINNPNPGTTNASTLAICAALKNSTTFKTTIYTIAFGKDIFEPKLNGPAAQDFLQDCASGTKGSNGGQDASKTQYYFQAQDAAKLAAAFASINTSVKAVRIVQ